MKPSKQRRVSRQHCSVVAPVWENELREILKQPVFLATFAYSDPPQPITDALERLCEVLGNQNSVTTTEFSASILKQAHGMLILLLGYNMSVHCATTDGSTSQANLDLTTLLCRSLLKFHLSVGSQAALSVEDCSETFWFLTQVTLRLGRLEKSEAPLGHCLSILERLSPKITSRLPMDQSRCLCLLLVRICREKSANQLRVQSLRLLRALEQHNCSHTARYARTALDAAERRPEPSILGAYGLSHTLFSWICAAQSCSGATKLVQTTGVVDQLRTIALEYDSDLSLAVQAADCLSSIAENDPSCTSIIRILLDVLVEAPMVVRERILRGLCSAHGRDGLIKLISWEDSERLKRTISALVEVILVKRKAIDYIEKNIQGIVSILLDCMTFDDTKRGSHTTGCVSHRDWASICIVLLESEKDPIVQLVVNRLCERLLRDRDQLVQHSPQILTGLAEVLQSSFTAHTTKLAVMNCFYELTQSPGEASIVLARQPKVLEAITLIASVHSDMTTDSASLTPTKRLALGTLLTLSKNVCNRRILARQVGVITCLIRYTRDHDPYDSDGILTIGRDTLKEHIVKLAEAL
jgi:hypothetical protein